MYQNFIALVDMFNEEVATPRNLTKFERSNLRPGSRDTLVTIPCRLAHIGDRSFGKVPEAATGD